MVALITGATSGIGESTAVLMAQKGWTLILTGRRTERLLKVKNKCLGAKEVFTLNFDVSKRSECERIYQENEKLLSRVDVLVNNAGLAKGVDSMPNGNFEDWEIMLDTNVKGLLYMTRLIVPHMIRRGSGDIVNLGSVAGRWVYPGGGVYCASKFAVRALTEGLRMDLNGTGVRVMNVEPGRVETEFSLVRLGDEAQAKKVYEGMTPLQAKDVAECILWMVERPKHVNISELVMFPTDQSSITTFNKK